MEFDQPVSAKTNFENIQIESNETDTFVLPEIDELFYGSRVNLFEFSMAIFSIKVKHNLTTNTVDDFIKLFKKTLPSQN